MSDLEEKNIIITPAKKVRKSRKYIEGEVILVDEEKLATPLPKEVSLTKANKVLKEKRPLTEKQQVNLKNLIELNRKRREESLAEREVIPSDIPEGKAVVTVKEKRTYKVKPVNTSPDLMEKIMEKMEKMEKCMVKPKTPKAKYERKKFVKQVTTEDDTTDFNDTDVDEKVSRKMNERSMNLHELEQKLQNSNAYVRHNLSIF